MNFGTFDPHFAQYLRTDWETPFQNKTVNSNRALQIYQIDLLQGKLKQIN